MSDNSTSKADSYIYGLLFGFPRASVNLVGSRSPDIGGFMPGFRLRYTKDVPAPLNSSQLRQILQHDLARTRCNGSGHDGFARLVVDVLDAPRLLARDLPQLAFGALAAVGLKAATQGKVAIALMAQPAAAKDLAQADGGEVVFSDIHAHHRAASGKLAA